MRSCRRWRADERVRPDSSQHPQGGGPPARARRLGEDHPRRVADRRAGRLLHRPRQLLQSGAAPRLLRGDQSLRRAAPPAVRRLQPRLHQRRRLRPGRRDRLGRPPPGGAPLHPLPRERDRRQQLSAAADHRPGAPHPPHRARRHGPGGRVHPCSASPTTRTRPSTSAGASRRSSTRRRSASRSGWRPSAASSPSGSAASGDRTRPAPAARRASASARCGSCATATSPRWRPTGHHLHHRRLQLGHRAALRRGLHAQPGRRADAGRERGVRGHREARGLVLATT